MRRRMAMFQDREQNKPSEKELNKREIGNLPNKEFVVMVIKMLPYVCQLAFQQKLRRSERTDIVRSKC